MRDDKYFLYPTHDWQRRYEALRASFVERLPAKIIAERFGYSQSYIHLLRHQFVHGKIDFSEPVPEGKTARHRVDSKIRLKICSWREHRLSAGEITQLLSEEGVELSVRTVERVLAEEGFTKLPRRSRLKLGLTVKGAKVPAVSEVLTIEVRFRCGYCMSVCPAGEDVIGSYIEDKKGYVSSVVKPLKDREEPVYVISGTEGESSVPKRFSHKTIKPVG
jgi:transposase